MLPTITFIPLVITAGVLTLVLWWPRIHRAKPSEVHLMAEVFTSIVVLFALILGLMAAAQRWPW